MPGFRELLLCCLHPVGAACEFVLSSQISNAGGPAMAAAAWSNEFSPKKLEKSS